MKEKIYTTIGVLAVGIPLNYHLPFSWWAIGYDVIMGTALMFVWRR